MVVGAAFPEPTLFLFYGNKDYRSPLNKVAIIAGKEMFVSCPDKHKRFESVTRHVVFS